MARKLPPIWLLGLTNSPLGINGAVALLITPQLLSAAHVPEPRIAAITGLALVPGFGAFLVSPVLDVRFSRRTYALGLNLACGAFTFAALMAMSRLAIVGWLLFAGIGAVQLAVSATGGWLTSLVAKEDESKLGAWFVVGNVGGFGVTSIVGILLLRHLPYPLGAAILSLLVVAPVAIFPFIPAPGPDRRLARESFGRFAGDVLAIVRQREVLLVLVLLAAPTASFALTNTLGGLGRDYTATESFVALIGGTGVTLGGIFGSLIVPPFAKRVPPRPLYLAIGIIGGLFTLALIVLPRIPSIYAVGMLGENIFQSAAFATANFVAFRMIGKNNPFAATQYALVLSAQSVPLSYMQVLDGRAYGVGGLSSMYLTDGGLGVAACAFMAVVLWLLARNRPKGAGEA